MADSQDGLVGSLHTPPRASHGPRRARTSRGWTHHHACHAMGSLGHALQADLPRDWAKLALCGPGGVEGGRWSAGAELPGCVEGGRWSAGDELPGCVEGGRGSAGAELHVVWSFSAGVLPFLFASAVGGHGLFYF